MKQCSFERVYTEEHTKGCCFHSEGHAGGLHGRTHRGTLGLHGGTLQKLGTGQVGQKRNPPLPGSGCLALVAGVHMHVGRMQNSNDATVKRGLFV